MTLIPSIVGPEDSAGNTSQSPHKISTTELEFTAEIGQEGSRFVNNSRVTSTYIYSMNLISIGPKNESYDTETLVTTRRKV